jgi:hypothetical protein
MSQDKTGMYKRLLGEGVRITNTDQTGWAPEEMVRSKASK